MTWDEVRTRVRQEIGKRLDVAVYRAGLQPRTAAISVPDGESGKFFFSAPELPERVRLLRHYLPCEVETLIQEADKISQHRYRLLGYRDLDYGKEEEIDWHLDAVHGKRTPLLPWYKIDFLDFAKSGDHKVIWELNRHQHLVILAKTWLLTGDDKYASEAIRQWYSWQRANPYPLGINWASSLEVAFRSLSWLWLRHLLGDCAVLPAGFHDDLQRALALNARHIERYLSTYFSPNTHLLGEAVALFFIGALYPQLTRAETWKDKGWKIILEEAHRQVRADGVYFEQSLYYHVYALDFFLHARLLASRNGVEIPTAFDDVIRKMLAVVQALAQVGTPDGFGDDDGGRVFNPRRNRSEHMTDPLALGAPLFRDQDLYAPVTEEAIWLFGADAVENSRKPMSRNLVPTNHCFANGGLYIAADEKPLPQQLVIDAGPQGTGRSGHGHADSLSLKLSISGRPCLIDAGTFCYIGDTNERQSFRGTRAHNTLAIDGLDQADPEGPFAWGALPAAQTECWIAASTFTLFAGSHSGYERLPEPVRHRRLVFHLRGSFWLVRDLIEGQGVHSFETSWHFAPDIQIVADTDGDRFVASSSASNAANSQVPLQTEVHLALVPVADSQWKCDLVRDFISPAYGVKIQAPVVRCTARVAAPTEHAMLLLASTTSIDNVCRLVRTVEPAATPHSLVIYRVDSDQAAHNMIFAPPQSAPWTHGSWSSDSSFFYFCRENEKITHLICCGGSFAQFQGRPLFESSGRLQYLEWTNRNGEQLLHSPDAAAASSFSESALEEKISV